MRPVIALVEGLLGIHDEQCCSHTLRLDVVADGHQGRSSRLTNGSGQGRPGSASSRAAHVRLRATR